MIFRPDACLNRFLEALRTGGLLDGAELCLFVSNHANNPADDTAAYTAIEATFGGYARRTLSTWSAPAVLSGYSISQCSPEVWMATGAGLPQSVWGIFVLDAGGDLLYAELDPDGATVLTAAGQTFSYLPRWADTNIV